jgi:beta-xylosidase
MASTIRPCPILATAASQSILSGDHPDPAILQDGADYYMTFSSFDAYPGLTIWHSRDLINWTPQTCPAQEHRLGLGGQSGQA